MIRIGILGAARITKTAMLDPAAGVDGVEVTAIAARDSERARRYAASHGIPLVFDSYEALLQSSQIDAVYIPLPAALHGAWTRAAVEAGKHVLVEKPFAANELEASLVAGHAAAAPVTVMEAYHTAHHPFMERIAQIVHGGELGRVISAEAIFCVPIPPGNDIRWNEGLGGGGLLDVGYYPVRLLRDLFGSEPAVVDARAAQRGAIDRRLDGTLRFESGVTGTVRSSIWSRRLFAAQLDVRGTDGRLRVTSPYHPHLRGIATVTSDGVRRREPADRRSTYSYQLEAFRDSIDRGALNRTDAVSATRQLAVIDDLYRAAGMTPRTPAASD